MGYIGIITHLLTIYYLSSWDIQVDPMVSLYYVGVSGTRHDDLTLEWSIWNAENPRQQSYFGGGKVATNK